MCFEKSSSCFGCEPVTNKASRNPRIIIFIAFQFFNDAVKTKIFKAFLVCKFVYSFIVHV